MGRAPASGTVGTQPEDKAGALRKAWEWAGHIHVATWLFEIGHGSSVVSAAFAAGAAYWTWSTERRYLPVFYAALGTFAGIIWGINGIVWLRAQARPSKARVTFDYSYGLSLEDVLPNLDVSNVDNVLEVRSRVRNAANGPMRIKVERFHTTIEDRFYTTLVAIETVLPRGGATILFPGGGFKREAFDKFPDRPTGRLELSILYGHPEDELSRRLTKTLKLSFLKAKSASGEVSAFPISWVNVEETDTPI
jgi:hypothetical protein